MSLNRRRDDAVRISGGKYPVENAPTHKRATVHFESLLGAMSHRATTKASPNKEKTTHALEQCIKHLDSVARHSTRVRPLSIATFKPLIFSIGGLRAKERADEFKSWKGELGDSILAALDPPSVSSE